MDYLAHSFEPNTTQLTNAMDYNSSIIYV